MLSLLLLLLVSTVLLMLLLALRFERSLLLSSGIFTGVTVALDRFISLTVARLRVCSFVLPVISDKVLHHIAHLLEVNEAMWSVCAE